MYWTQSNETDVDFLLSLGVTRVFHKMLACSFTLKPLKSWFQILDISLQHNIESKE